jgi:hypothetical protein
MAQRSRASTKKGSKRRRLSKVSCSTKLYEDNHRRIQQMMKADGAKESEVLRECISQYFRNEDVKALGRNQVEDPIRTIYERVIGEQLAPVLATIQQMKTALEKLSTGAPNKSQTSAPSALSGEDVLRILTSIDGLRSLIEQTGSDLTESGAAQTSQLDQLHQSQLALQTIGSETFASSWTIADLLIRYLVEVALRNQEMEPDRVEQIVAGERRGLRLEGLKKIAEIESFFELPEKYRLAQRVLTSRTFPLSNWSSSSAL